MMKLGQTVFLVGFFGAVLVGLLSAFGIFEIGALLTAVLVLAGVVIGFMNASAKEQLILMVSALVIGAGSASLVALDYVGEFIGAILGALALVAIPMGLVIALKAFYDKAQA